LPVGVDAAELEDRIMQHFAAMGRIRRLARREGLRNSSAHQTAHHPQLETLSSSSDSNESDPTPVSDSETATNDPIRANDAVPIDSAGPSELQSLSETWKSRLSSMSMKYKESISRSTRGWKEKLFSRSTTMAEIGSEVMNAGVASVSRMMERLETTRESN
ncbi:hypothetical protein M569_06653, partial [Genlisea aurea]